MKKLLAVLVVFTALLFCSYFMVGQRVESVFTESTAKVTEHSPNIVFTLKEKAKGFFSSRYVYTLQVSLPPELRTSGAPTNLAMDLVYNVAHGPLPLTAGDFTPCLALCDTTLSPETSGDKAVTEFFKGVPELAKSTLRTRIAFDSSSTTQVAVPAFVKTISADKSAPFTITFKGLTGTIRTPSTYDAYKAALSSPGLSLQDADATLVCGTVSLQGDSKLMGRRLWTGTQRLAVETADFLPKTGAAVKLQKLALDASLTPQNGTLDYVFALSGNQTLPQGNALPVAVSFTGRNLDMAALDTLIALMEKVQSTGEDLSKSESELRAVVNAMLPKKPAVEIDAKAFEGSDQILLHCEIRPEGLTSLPQQILATLPFLRAKADFSGPQKAVTDFACSVLEGVSPPQQSKEECARGLSREIDQILAQGLMQRDGDKLSASAQWDGQKLTVNGKPLL